MGMQEAVTAIIGNEIGANNIKLAQLYNKVIACIAACVLILLALTLYFCRSSIAGLFTQEPAVFTIIIVVIKILSVIHLADGG